MRSEPAAEETAERRHLTVMFGDLVGLTALSALLDPEDLRNIYRNYRDACVRVVDRYYGLLAQFMGDGVLVYFGYPQAHKDDAERAVRAGLDIVATVRWLRTPNGGQIEARIGIATGVGGGRRSVCAEGGCGRRDAQSGGKPASGGRT